MQDNFILIYNNFIKLTTNKNLYKHLTSQDTFSDRLIFFLIHFSFFLKTYKSPENRKLLQKIYDFNFRQLELSIREIGYGDQTINKKMKDYLNLFHYIISDINDWDNLNISEKNKLLSKFIDHELKDHFLVNYFDDYSLNLSKKALNLFIKSVNNH